MSESHYKHHLCAFVASCAFNADASSEAAVAPSIPYAFQTLIGSSLLDRQKLVQSASDGLGHVTQSGVRSQRLFSDQLIVRTAS